jgi:6-phosphogluconate dehydrogenase
MDNLTTIFINNIKKYGFDCPNSKNFLLVILKTIFDLIDNHNVISDTAFKNIFDKMWHNLTSQFNELCQEEAQTSLFEMTNDNFAQYKNNHLPDNLNQEHCHSNYFADITLTPEPNFFTDWTINSII